MPSRVLTFGVNTRHGLAESGQALQGSQITVNARLKALDEIYKIYKTFAPLRIKNSAKFRQTFSHFYRLILTVFFKSGRQFTNLDETFSQLFQQFVRKISTSPILKFPGASQRIFLKCSENDFGKVRNDLELF